MGRDLARRRTDMLSGHEHRVGPLALADDPEHRRRCDEDFVFRAINGCNYRSLFNLMVALQARHLAHKLYTNRPTVRPQVERLGKSRLLLI